MGRQNKKSNSLLMQGSILAVASIVSRIIGLIYRIPILLAIPETIITEQPSASTITF